jgi:hypothetical protein
LRCTSAWCAGGCQSHTAPPTRPAANEAAVAPNLARLVYALPQLLFCVFCLLYLPPAIPAPAYPRTVSLPHFPLLLLCFVRLVFVNCCLTMA